MTIESMLNDAISRRDWLTAGMCQVLLQDGATGWAALALEAIHGGELWADVEDVGHIPVGAEDAAAICELHPQRVWLAITPDTYAAADDIIGGML